MKEKSFRKYIILWNAFQQPASAVATGMLVPKEKILKCERDEFFFQ